MVGAGGVTVTDLCSRNGSSVNGRRIEDVTPLAHRDELRVGPARIVVSLAYAEMTLTETEAPGGSDAP